MYSDEKLILSFLEFNYCSLEYDYLEKNFKKNKKDLLMELDKLRFMLKIYNNYYNSLLINNNTLSENDIILFTPYLETNSKYMYILFLLIFRKETEENGCRNNDFECDEIY